MHSARPRVAIAACRADAENGFSWASKGLDAAANGLGA